MCVLIVHCCSFTNDLDLFNFIKYFCSAAKSCNTKRINDIAVEMYTKRVRAEHDYYIHMAWNDRNTKMGMFIKADVYFTELVVRWAFNTPPSPNDGSAYVHSSRSFGYGLINYNNCFWLIRSPEMISTGIPTCTDEFHGFLSMVLDWYFIIPPIVKLYFFFWLWKNSSLCKMSAMIKFNENVSYLFYYVYLDTTLLYLLSWNPT